MTRIAWICLLGVLAALVAATPAAADAPVLDTVTKRIPVRDGKVTESKVRCPRGLAAVAGYVSRQPGDSTLRKSLPSGVRTWRFALGGYVGTKATTATAVVRCVGLTVPSRAGEVRLNVNTVSGGVGVEALGRRSLAIRCRSGYTPTGWGFDIPSPNANQPVLPAEETQVFKALATTRGYAFGLENLGAGDQIARLRVRCLDRAVAGRGGLSHTWRVRRKRYSNRIGAGVRTVRHACRRGYLSVGLGHSIDPAGDVLFRRAYVARTGSGRWRFDNAGGTDRVTTQLGCLSGRTDFR